jgi:hypothetical protein
MGSILRHLFGFGELELLTGANATYATLSNMLRQLSGTFLSRRGRCLRESSSLEITGLTTDSLTPDNTDCFVLYLSGHGVKWTGTAADEAILASDVKFFYDDSKEWVGHSHLITDGFWSPFLSSVAENVPVTLIFDTCHSGKGYRAKGRPKYVDIDFFRFEDPPRNDEVWHPSAESRFVFLAAAAHQQVATEIPRSDGTSGSALVAAIEDVLFENHSNLVGKIFFFCFLFCLYLFL